MTDPESPTAEANSATGYAVPPGQYTVTASRGPKYFVTLGIWAVVLATGMMILAVLDNWVPNVPNRYVCPPDCGRPPSGLPVATNPRFTSPGGEFSVSYPAPGAAYNVTIDADGVTAVWTAGDGGTLRLFSQAADGRNAEQVAGSLMDDLFPDARIAYQLPNAAVGYRPGYGHVADFQPMVASYQSTLLRVIIVVAVKNDLALIALAAGPFHEFTPSFGPGPPSPANLQIAQDMGKYVNSFSWRGDPPR